ncbi:MAG: asparaginase [Alphaproteobacteria bacterium]|nr:asparaginase [Alphaproteobacteria bacterium]
MASQKRNILVLLTGGTIASVPSDENGSLTPDKSDQFSALVQNLIEQEFSGAVSVSYRQVFNKDSSEFRVGNWEVLAKVVYREQLNYDAFVVMHGTDSMEYGLPVLEFMGYDKKSCLSRKQALTVPVIFTGSMKPLQEEGNDAEGNIKTAFRTAITFSDKNVPGVYLAFDGQIHSGVHVTKIDPEAYNAFSSNGYVIAKEIYDKIILSPRGEARIQTENAILAERNRITSKGIQLNKLKMKYFDENNIMQRVSFNTMKYTPHSEIQPANKYSGALFIEGLGAGNIPPFFSEKIKNRVSQTHFPVILTTQYSFRQVMKTYELARKAEMSGAILSPEMPLSTLYAKFIFMMNCPTSGVENLYDLHKAMYTSYLGEEVKNGNPNEEIPNFISEPAEDSSNNFKKLIAAMRDFVVKEKKDKALYLDLQNQK